MENLINLGSIGGLLIGFGLAASAGFRVFVPLLALSIFSKLGFVPLGEAWQWVGSTPAIVALGFATVLEIIGFYVPWLDNALDTVAVPAAGIAGTAVMASTAVDIDPLWQWAMAIIAGGGTAAAIKGSNAGTRLASSTATGGLANPVLATVETASATGLSLLSVFFAPLAVIIGIGLLILVFFVWKKIRKKFKRKVS